MLARNSQHLKHLDENLTLNGLRIIWDRTR